MITPMLRAILYLWSASLVQVSHTSAKPFNIHKSKPSLLYLKTYLVSIYLKTISGYAWHDQVMAKWFALNQIRLTGNADSVFWTESINQCIADSTGGSGSSIINKAVNEPVVQFAARKNILFGSDWGTCNKCTFRLLISIMISPNVCYYCTRIPCQIMSQTAHIIFIYENHWKTKRPKVVD